MEAHVETEILKMFDSHMSPTQIATELELSLATISSVLKRHGRAKMVKPPSPEETEIGNAYATGVDIPELLQKYSLTYTRLYALLSKLEIPLRRSSEAVGRKNSLDQAVALYQQGVPLWKIKSETGVAQPTLHDALHTRKIPLRKPRAA